MWPILNPEVWREEGREQLLEFEPWQLDFGTSWSNATLAAGGWGSGKTTAGFCFESVSSWSNPPGTAGMIVLPTHQLVEEYLEKAFIPAFQKVIVGHSIKRRCFYLPGNRSILYRSGHDPERLEFSTISWAYLDEPHLMVEEVLRKILARSRRKGSRIRVGMTSLPKMGWLSREFKDRSDQMRRVIHCSTEANAHNLHPAYIPNIKSICPRRMLDCYLKGLFVPSGGAVYSEFKRETHVIPWVYSPAVRNRWGQWLRTKIGVVVDWSPRRPHVLWTQRVPAGTMMPGGWFTTREVAIVVDEIIPDGEYQAVTTRRLCQLINDRRAPDGQPYPIEYAVCDPAGTAIQSTSGMSDVHQLEKFLGVPALFEHGQRNRVGVQHVQLALDPVEGHPFLFFSDQLLKNMEGEEENPRGVIQSMEGLSYPEPGKKGALADEPEHDAVHSHSTDCVKYHTHYFFAVDRLSVERTVVT